MAPSAGAGVDRVCRVAVNQARGGGVSCLHEAVASALRIVYDIPE